MSEQVIEKELQEMELPSQSKTKANAAAKPGDPMPKAGSNASNVQTPGNSASYQDLGGPTVDNNKPDDDSNKLSSGSGVTQSSTASNSGKHSGGSGDAQDSTTKNKYLYNSVDWSADVDALVGTEELSEEELSAIESRKAQLWLMGIVFCGIGGAAGWFLALS